MRRKLLTVVALLGIAVLASWAPGADAAAYCSKEYCRGKDKSSVCACPPGTDRVGTAVTCATYGNSCFAV
jgi:hypothetical protein